MPSPGPCGRSETVGLLLCVHEPQPVCHSLNSPLEVKSYWTAERTALATSILGDTRPEQTVELMESTPKHRMVLEHMNDVKPPVGEMSVPSICGSQIPLRYSRLLPSVDAANSMPLMTKPRAFALQGHYRNRPQRTDRRYIPK